MSPFAPVALIAAAAVSIDFTLLPDCCGRRNISAEAFPATSMKASAATIFPNSFKALPLVWIWHNLDQVSKKRANEKIISQSMGKNVLQHGSPKNVRNADSWMADGLAPTSCGDGVRISLGFL